MKKIREIKITKKIEVNIYFEEIGSVNFQLNEKYKKNSLWLVANRGDVGDALVFNEKTKKFYIITDAFNNRLRDGELNEVSYKKAFKWMIETDCAMQQYWTLPKMFKGSGLYDIKF